LDRLPSALQRKDEIFRLLHEKTPAIFLDYDGTLTPIVDDPAEAKKNQEGYPTAGRELFGLYHQWPRLG
ncbi:hypothetical protein ACFLV4_05760, partial [Chloroflexota bacterium]